MTERRYIAYYRVSTDKQGESGLGLEAQRKAVLDYLDGGQWELIDEYTEVESGKRNKRPQLEAALKACKKQKATLAIAKLDRLSRDAHFLLGLQKANLDFVACDMPEANRLTIGIMALVAEEEGRMISARTKAALAAVKERGVKLGTHGATAFLPERNRRRADEFALSIAPTIERLKRSGYTTLQAIADQLNRMGVPTAREGARWHIPTVFHLIKRIERLS